LEGDDMTGSGAWSLRSMLIRVSDLDRASQFYTDVCGLREIVREADAALLGVEGTELTLDLRLAHRQGVHGGQQTLGLRACSFYVGSTAELERVEGRLKALSAFQDRKQQGEDGRIGLVQGHDPDRLPLAFLSYEPPLTEADYRSLLSLIYAWDL
jgi:catechol 2,3-dioxygenase-like lactoylglutathione lyase family enzyme